MTTVTVGEIVELFERWGSERYDEDVAQLEHALQAAALAVDGGASDALVVACLLHDIGHLLDLRDGHESAGVDLRHEDAGAAWLRPLLPPAVTAPIALHVRAKRYLCAVDPAYEGGLSDGSVRSLALQGGPMTAAEIEAFRALPGFGDAVRLRRWDDEGKVRDHRVAPLADYVQLLESLTSA